MLKHRGKKITERHLARAIAWAVWAGYIINWELDESVRNADVYIISCWMGEQT